MICIRSFLEFLSEYKCLGAYWANFEKSNFAGNYHAATMAISSVFEYSPRVWLLRSFNWERSKEGFKYWSNLDTLWNMRCNYLLKNED